MNETIEVGSKVFLGSININEGYIQNLIFQNPKVIGLGNLVVVEKERKQSSGGRLDILLKNPEDNTMYEIEIMLGETDPSHIIRTIEYWDIEKRRFPLRSHFAVLIAESFSRRYFNVIQLLGLNVPIIAIQLDALKTSDKLIINFTKILDVYEEQEDDDSSIPVVTENEWTEKSKWTVNNMKYIYETLLQIDDQVGIKYLQSYISVTKNGKNMYSAYSKAEPNSMLWFHVADEELAVRIKDLLEVNGIIYNYNKYKDYMMNITSKENLNKELLYKIHKIRIGKEEEGME